MRRSSRVPAVVASLLGISAGLTVAGASEVGAAPATTSQHRLAPDDGLSHSDPAGQGMVVTKAAAVAGQPRAVRHVDWQRRVVAGPGADPWSTFVAQSGGSWQSAWDHSTQTPLRLWGSGLPAPGSMKSPQAAEAFARKILEQHLALLAPGAAAADFQLVSNDYDGDIRTLGFLQTFQGMPVVGGQVSFRFKNDRLVVIASEALPNIQADVPDRRSRAASSRMRAQVTSELAALGLPATAAVTAVDGGQPLLLPIIGDASVLGYRVVVPHQIDGGDAGRWISYADARTGETVGLVSQSFYASGKLSYRVVKRHALSDRVDVPASRMDVSVGGTAMTTAEDGTVTWTANGSQSLVPSLAGLRVKAVNKAGALATANLTIAPDGTTVWDATAVATDDAQLNVVIHVNEAKTYVRTFAPGLAELDMPITVNVNIDQECNASFDGSALNFFKSSTRCQNTGLISDVVYHEFGHAMHFYSIIEGVGRMEGAFSEGLSDFLAASITDDPGMGRGFFYNNDPLRNLDPANKEPRWPDDVGEIHKTGIIYGAAMWDLRKALIANLGRAAAVPLTNKLYYASVRRASDIPSTLIEVLLADDDDGNLANGTPNECDILEAFGKHGLRVVSGVTETPGRVNNPGGRQLLSFALTGRSPRCPTDAVTGVEVSWSPGATGKPTGGKIAATQGADLDHWTAEVPLPTSDAMKYSATVTFASSVKLLLPDNFADAAYQLYEGETTPLLCANMDENPLTAGWTTEGDAGWQWGPPSPMGSTEPHASFTGSNILAIGLGTDYKPDAEYTLKLPTIDVGHYSDVRLQFRRWLAVEDSQFDKATIFANGKVAWINASDHLGNDSALHHIDREWRFTDVPLSSRFRGSQLDLAFSLTTDGGLEFGGWSIDDLCVVADPSSICGDGKLSGAEECDDGTGNSDSPNKCRVDCKIAACGDGIVDRGEECDDGAATDHCAATCLLADDSGGCCDAGGNPAASMLISLGVLGLVTRRRRRAAAAS